MKLKTITYQISTDINNNPHVGQTRNDTVSFVAELEAGDVETEVAAQLKEKALACLEESLYSLGTKHRKLRNEIDELRRKCNRSKSNWERIQEFLKAQGIRPDAPDFPALVEKVEGELVEEGEEAEEEEF